MMDKRRVISRQICTSIARSLNYALPTFGGTNMVIEHSEIKNASKDGMMKQMVEDNSRAFLDAVQPSMTASKVEAETTWWKALAPLNNAPNRLNSADDMNSMLNKGWSKEPNSYFNQLSKTSADGKLKETDTYDLETGLRASQDYLRFDDPAKEAKQLIEIGFGADGKTPVFVFINSSSPNSQHLIAHFNENEKLRSVEEFGDNHDFVDFTFRTDGSLYESVSRSRQDNSVVSDQLFNSKGEPLSDLDPSYLTNDIRATVNNVILEATRIIGAIF